MNAVYHALASLECITVLSITTSGYRDRFLSYETRYEAEIYPGALTRWDTSGAAARFIDALLKSIPAGQRRESATPENGQHIVAGCRQQTYGRWSDGRTNHSGPINRQAVGAVLDANNSSLGEGARHEAATLAARLVGEPERAFIRWQLFECNRQNARLELLGLRPIGTTQVVYPGYEYSEGAPSPWGTPEKLPPPGQGLVRSTAPHHVVRDEVGCLRIYPFCPADQRPNFHGCVFVGGDGEVRVDSQLKNLTREEWVVLDASMAIAFADSDAKRARASAAV